MGRSVSYAIGSLIKAYIDITHLNDISQYNEIEAQDNWDYFIEDLKDRLKVKYKSLSECDKWLDREDYAILENDLVYIGLSEYMGLVCLWVVPKDFNYYEENKLNLAIKWCNSIEKGFLKEFSQLRRLGTFSNGESVFERMEAK